MEEEFSIIYSFTSSKFRCFLLAGGVSVPLLLIGFNAFGIYSILYGLDAIICILCAILGIALAFFGVVAFLFQLSL